MKIRRGRVNGPQPPDVSPRRGKSSRGTVLAVAGGEVVTHHPLLGAGGDGQAASAQIRRAVHAGPVAGRISQVLLLIALASTVGLGGTGWFVGLSCGVILDVALAQSRTRYRLVRLAPADWVTLARATLAIGVAALVADSFDHRTAVTALVSLTVLALSLDAVDGWVARRTMTTARFGALFDGEVDAFLMLVLSVYVARSYGAWVLAIGASRYAFLAAGWSLAWMRAPLPPRYWRKVVTATQGIVLTIAAADILPLVVSRALLVVALALLAESFGRDVWWLWRHRMAAERPIPAGADLSLNLKTTAGPGTGRGPVRTKIGAALTILAFVLVWAALIAPGQPQVLTLTAFLRVPLEGLVLVAVAAFLPAVPRRLLAAVLGPTLAVLVILKILDIGFYTYFARPFDIIGDGGDAGIGVETLRGAIGHTRADLLIVGGVALAVSLLVFITLAMLRMMRVAAANRRGSLRVVSALGAVWLLCSVFGAQLLSHTPIATAGSAGFFVHEVGAVEADLRDETVFANQIRHDPFRYIPGNQLLTGLRGKDVLLVFLESYGQVSVEGSSFSAAIDALLDKGTKQLQSAGFTARSAFVNAPGFGGLSWLAHSTLQSGVWANTQTRYDKLVASNRFTLSDAFKRAGWRTINFAPADDESWADGSSFYHYDKLYARRDLGYHGPTYSYATMPDQYMFAALQRLELSKPHRRPLFAEVDTVSSHMPWYRIPQMIPWNEIGNGSIFNHTPTFTEPSSSWWHPNQVKADYARSLRYSLNALISFVQHYGKKNLVLMVVGDEQPLAIVSGQGASRDVPISLIAHDPSVLKRITGWGWQAGLLPSPRAPVWPMSAVRDRFFTTFGPRPAAGRH